MFYIILLQENSRQFVLWFLLCLFLFLMCGCASYKIKTEEFQEPCMDPNKQEALGHWLYKIVPRHRCQIRWYDVGHWCTWTLFGNDDDGIFGEESTAHYRPYQKVNFGKALAWKCRNPFHNFCFYVIGSAHRRNSELTILKLTSNDSYAFRYKHEALTVLPFDQSYFFLAFHGGKPFISWRLIYSRRRCFDFYLGWRCRGNFGLKCLPFATIHKPSSL
jgi:hypothetical protein